MPTPPPSTLRATGVVRDRPQNRALRAFVRAWRVRLAVIYYVVRRMGLLVLAVVAYTALAAAVLRWDLARHGHPLPDLESTLYGLYTQLFEPTDGFPPTRLSRLVFWVTPVVGVVFIAEGLLKVGASIFDLTTRREVWVRIVTGQMRGHIVVCGLGHVGYRVIEELRKVGEDVVAIDKGGSDTFVELVRAMDVPVHIGDARRDDLLASVRVDRAKAVVCATGDDLANLEIALDCKKLNARIRVVMRMFDQRLAAKVGGALELEESFSTSSLAAPLIAIQASHHGVHSAYRLDDAVRVTAEVPVGARHRGGTVTEIEDTVACRVVSRRAPGDASFSAVRGRDAVRPGDVLIVDTAAIDLPSVLFNLAG